MHSEYLSFLRRTISGTTWSAYDSILGIRRERVGVYSNFLNSNESPSETEFEHPIPNSGLIIWELIIWATC